MKEFIKIKDGVYQVVDYTLEYICFTQSITYIK